MAQEINKRTWSEVVKRASCFLSKSVSRPNAKIILRFSPSVPMSEIFFAHAYLIFPPQTLFGTVRRALRCVTDYPPLLALLGILSAKEEVGRGGERRGRRRSLDGELDFFQVRPPLPISQSAPPCSILLSIHTFETSSSPTSKSRGGGQGELATAVGQTGLKFTKEMKKINDAIFTSHISVTSCIFLKKSKFGKCCSRFVGVKNPVKRV